MRLRAAWPFAVLILAAIALGGWMVKRRADAAARGHAAAIERARREPGSFVADPALDPGEVEVDVIAPAPDIELGKGVQVRIGQQTRQCSASGRARFEGLTAKSDKRASVVGDYVAESAVFELPPGDHGGRIALRAIPIDPPMVGPPFEKQMEVSIADPASILLLWKQQNVVVAETTVSRGAGQGALVEAIHKEWMQMGSHRDPADRKLDRATVRVKPGALLGDVLPVVEAILATRREMNLGGESRTIAAFDVSLQPPLPPLSRRRDSVDDIRPSER